MHKYTNGLLQGPNYLGGMTNSNHMDFQSMAVLMGEGCDFCIYSQFVSDSPVGLEVGVTTSSNCPLLFKEH